MSAFFHEAKKSIDSFNSIHVGKTVKCIKILPFPSELKHRFLSFNFERMWKYLFDNPDPSKYDVNGYDKKKRGVDVTGVAGVNRRKYQASYQPWS